MHGSSIKMLNTTRPEKLARKPPAGCAWFPVACGTNSEADPMSTALKYERSQWTLHLSTRANPPCALVCRQFGCQTSSRLKHYAGFCAKIHSKVVKHVRRLTFISGKSPIFGGSACRM